MNVWLITVGESLPILGRNDRLLRTGLLAERLVQRGHDVLWWTSTVDHFRKQLIVSGEPRLPSSIGAELQFIRGQFYKKNVSLSRLKNHLEIAHRFRELSRAEEHPDVILCSFPTIELCREAVLYGKEYRIPVVIDVRDLWPDIFLELFPSWIKYIGLLLLRKLFLDAKFALANADAIYAVSKSYLAWGLKKAGRNATNRDKVFPLAYKPSLPTLEDSACLMGKLPDLEVSEAKPIIVFAGTFGQTYDLATVLLGVRKMNLSNAYKPQFVFCGTGELHGEWKALASGLENVYFPGWLSVGELAQLLAWADIGIAAYARGAPQGIPNKVIEYMSAGLPVLCSLPGEARILLESSQCGLYYEAGNAESFATALSGLLFSPSLRAEMGKKSKAIFECKFTSEMVYEDMIDELELLTSG